MLWKAWVGVLLALLAMSARGNDVVVTEAWVRETVAGQTASAAYLALNSREGSTLMAVSSPLAQAHLHKMVMDNGVMRMQALDSLALPAGQTVVLRPGSYHIMLSGLKHVLRVGEFFPLSLRVMDGRGRVANMEIRAVVRDLAGQPVSRSAQPHAHHMH